MRKKGTKGARGVTGGRKCHHRSVALIRSKTRETGSVSGDHASWLQILLKIFDEFTGNRILGKIYSSFLRCTNRHRLFVHRDK